MKGKGRILLSGTTWMWRMFHFGLELPLKGILVDTGVIVGMTAEAVYLHRNRIEDRVAAFFDEESAEPYAGRFTTQELHGALVKAMSCKEIVPPDVTLAMIHQAEERTEAALRSVPLATFRNPFEREYGFLCFMNRLMSPLEDSAHANRRILRRSTASTIVVMRDTIEAESVNVRAAVLSLVRLYRAATEPPPECPIADRLSAALSELRGVPPSLARTWVNGSVRALRERVRCAAGYAVNGMVLDDAFISAFGHALLRDSIMGALNTWRCPRIAA